MTKEAGAPDGRVACPGCWTLRAPQLDVCDCGERRLPRREVLAADPNPFALLRAMWLKLTSPTGAAEAALAHAEGLVEEGRVDDALEAAESAVRRDPADPRTFLARARAHQLQGDLPAATADLERALRLVPGDPALLAARSEVRRAAGEPEGALADLTAALRVEPAAALLWRRRATAHEALRRWSEAERDHREGLRLEPGGLDGWLDWCVFLGDRGRAAEALAAAETTLALAPTNATALNNRGWARLLVKELTGAQADLEEAIRLSPDAWLPRSNLARVHLAQRRLEFAVARAEEAVRLAGDTTTTAWRVLANACAHEGNHVAAGEALEQAWRVSGEREVEARLLHARLLGRSGRFEAALTLLAPLEELAAEEASIRFQLMAVQRWRLGDLAQACQDATAAVQLTPSLASARTLRARLRSIAGDAEGARADLARLQEMSPDALGVSAERAAILDRAGARAEADADWARVVAGADDDPETFAWLLLWSARHAEARAVAEKACLARPRHPHLWHALAIAREALGDADGARDARVRAEALDREGVVAWDRALALHRARTPRPVP